MDITLLYAFIIGGGVGVLLLINSLPSFIRLFRYLSPLISKYLTYRYILHRQRFLGPWSRAGVLVQLIYIAGNICYFNFWETTISQARLWAGTLAIINLIPVFGPHLNTLADLFDVTLSTFRQIHRSAGVTAAALVFHVLAVVVSQPSFPLDLPRSLLAVIVNIILGHIPPLTLYIGSVITKVHDFALPVSLWKHAKVYPGKAPLAAIIRAEVAYRF